MAIHQKLKRLRVDRHLSQQELADKLHISQNAYSLIENGMTKIDEQRIHQLSEALNIHPFELLGDENVTLNFYDKVENGYATYIQTLNAENKELTSLLQKKDEQIDKLLAHIDSLTAVLSTYNLPNKKAIKCFAPVRVSRTENMLWFVRQHSCSEENDHCTTSGF